MDVQLTPTVAGDADSPVEGRLALRALLPLLLMVVIVGLSPLLRLFEQSLGLPLLFHARGAITAPDSVVVVAMNADSARALDLPTNTQQWSRKVHAQMVDKLVALGARAVVFDIAFKAVREGQQDQQLANALENANNVVLVKYLQRYQPPGSQVDIEQEMPPVALVGDAALTTASFVLPKIPISVNSAPLTVELSQGIEATLPLATLLVYYRDHLAAFNDLLRQIDPSLVAPVLSASGSLQAWVNNVKQIQRLKPYFADELSVSIEREPMAADRHIFKTLLAAFSTEQPLMINYYGPPGSVPTYTYDQLLLDKVVPDLHNKVVFIGFAETRQTEQVDAYHTVFTNDNGVDISGVEIGATVFANLQQGEALRSPEKGLVVAVLLVWAGCLFWCIYRLPIKHAAWLVALPVAGYVLLVIAVFARYQLWLPVIVPVVMPVFAGVAALLARYHYSRLLQAKITDALGYYLPKEAAVQLSQDFRRIHQQHHVVQGVCLLSDLQGYTAIAEQLAPDELHRHMNLYFENIMAQVVEQQGTVANIVGDGMLAMWTDAEVNPYIVVRACCAALALIDAVKTFQLNDTLLPTSVALHAGQFSLGNLGAINHYEYSPVGDIVNTTSRLEALNRQLNTRVLLTESVAQHCHAFAVRYVGKFAVKNKQQPLTVYELLGEKNDELSQRCVQFEAALAHYEAGDMAAATETFSALQALWPDDGPTQYYRKLLRS